MSDSLLLNSSTFHGATFSSLGVTPGTYERTWGTGPNQSFTLRIGGAAVPDSDSSFGLSFVAVSDLFRVRRLSYRLPA